MQLNWPQRDLSDSGAEQDFQQAREKYGETEGLREKDAIDFAGNSGKDVLPQILH